MKQGMKESYEKGVANRSAPEFCCAAHREGVQRSVNRVQVGWVLSFEKMVNQGR